MVTHPVPAWLLFTAATWFWHLPPIYELALGFGRLALSAARLFSRHRALVLVSRHSTVSRAGRAGRPGCLIPYLILADVQNTLLSALLTFSDQPLYSYYVERPRLGNLSALEDQAAAGVLMWVPGSVAYLVPLFVIGVRLLFGASDTPEPSTGSTTRPEPWPSVPSPAGSSCRSSAQPRPLGRAGSLRCLASPSARSLSPLAACSAQLASPSAAAGRADRLRWLPRAADRSHEPGRRTPLDSLARSGGPGVAGGRQRLLHGLSVHGAADARAALASAGPELAALVAEQMAGGRLARRASSGRTRHSLSGTAPGGPPGSPWPTSRLPS